MLIRVDLLVAIVLTAEGCVGWTAPTLKIDTLSLEAREATLRLPILKEDELTGKEHTVIASVNGTSCQYWRTTLRRRSPTP